MNKTSTNLIIFQIKEDGNVVSSGEIYETEESQLLTDIPPFKQNKCEHVSLSKKDVYKEFIIRNYNYEWVKNCLIRTKFGNLFNFRDKFKVIASCNSEVTSGLLEWETNFVSFLDGLFQFPLIQVDTRKLRVPVAVDRIDIDVENQLKVKENLIPIEYHPQSGILR